MKSRNCNNCVYFVPVRLDQDRRSGGECRVLPPRICDAVCAEFPCVPNGSTWFCGSHTRPDFAHDPVVRVCVDPGKPDEAPMNPTNCANQDCKILVDARFSANRCGGISWNAYTPEYYGCGRFFCGHHLVGHRDRGPLYCRPCWDTHPTEPRSRKPTGGRTSTDSDMHEFLDIFARSLLGKP